MCCRGVRACVEGYCTKMSKQDHFCASGAHCGGLCGLSASPGDGHDGARQRILPQSARRARRYRKMQAVETLKLYSTNTIACSYHLSTYSGSPHTNASPSRRRFEAEFTRRQSAATRACSGCQSSCTTGCRAWQGTLAPCGRCRTDGSFSGGRRCGRASPSSARGGPLRKKEWAAERKKRVRRRAKRQAKKMSGSPPSIKKSVRRRMRLLTRDGRGAGGGERVRRRGGERRGELQAREQEAGEERPHGCG